MADITLLPSAKVPLIYEGDLTMTTEWYRFFWNIYGFTGSGAIPVNKGGTGLTSIGNHQLIIGNANNVFEPASLSSNSLSITYPAGFINIEIGSSGVTAGTYGAADTVGVFTVNQYGVLTAASNALIAINANQITSYYESYQIATQGQTVFSGLIYMPGNNSLKVYVNGSKQITTVNYTETSSTSITFLNGLNAGDYVEFVQ